MRYRGRSGAKVRLTNQVLLQCHHTEPLHLDTSDAEAESSLLYYRSESWVICRSSSIVWEASQRWELDIAIYAPPKKKDRNHISFRNGKALWCVASAATSLYVLCDLGPFCLSDFLAHLLHIPGSQACPNPAWSVDLRQRGRVQWAQTAVCIESPQDLKRSSILGLLFRCTQCEGSGLTRRHSSLS